MNEGHSSSQGPACGLSSPRGNFKPPLARARGSKGAPHPSDAKRQRGFALLLTITLLAFIVLLLLGLAVYTRVETAVAGNTQRQAQARENALLALNVAVAQLQRHAGPDTRVSATAHSFGAINGTRPYTGIWSSNVTATDTPGTPLTWLVSGNELTQPDPNPDAPAGSRIPAPLAVTPVALGNRTVDLVGRNTTGSAARTDYVTVPLTDLTATGVPGAPPAAATTIGRYAWWVGDQGVKAPVAVADTSDTVTYAPYDSAELRSRVRQQIALGAGAADGSGAPLFEPRDGNNSALVAGQKVTTPSQFSFLRTAANAQIGLLRQQQNFHAWSPNNFSVLANTKSGGLKQDLSLAPALLGDAFAAWANYPAYMEKFLPDPPVSNGEGGSVEPVEPVASTTPAILPAYGEDPMRRRYVITPPLEAGGAIHSVAPALSFFGMSFSVRENSSDVPQMEVAVRCVISLWNPYSSSLVPENLRVEVTGLPVIQVADSAGGNHRLNLQRAMAGSTDEPFRFALPWTIATDEVGKNSWLPGRVFSWAAIENTSDSSEGNPMVFHSPDATPEGAGEGIVRPARIDHEVNSLSVTDPILRTCALDDAATLRVRVRRASDDVLLADYSIEVAAFGPTSPIDVTHKYVDFAIVRRLPETDELPVTSSEKWLSASGRDPRNPRFPSIGLTGANGEDPSVFGGENRVSFPVRASTRLLDRGGGSLSYNEDVPVFELPRSPLLSLGQLQHLQLSGQRPFMIGNPWGSTEALNNVPLGELFDRFYFSGLVDGVVPSTTTTGDLILPNPLLKPLRKPDRSKVTIDDVRTLMSPPTTTDADGNVVPTVPASSFSSKFFLQGGTFNLNSVNVAAWAAVLRSVRFPAPQSFTYLDAQAATGTADDSAVATLQSTDAQFFRFSQSAQETYKAEAGAADPNETSPANTHLFRRGMRTLTASEVAALAAKIVELVGVKQAAADPAGGPFRSLDEFLAPSTLFAGVDADGNPLAPRSLLEAAIADAGINANIAEFSSQWLTQADVMTALAPVLFPRSDTFIIRTYGEAVNPMKLPIGYRPGDTMPSDAIEGRAWCEAIVQRVPEYLADAANIPPETDPAVFGTPSDPDDPTSAPTQAYQLNATHGRRFKVISFRWLTRADI